MLGADIAWRRQSHGVQVLEGNLRRVIGTGAGNGELRTLSRKVMRSYARYYLEDFRLHVIPRERLLGSGLHLEGAENLQRSLEYLKNVRGVIYALPHMGNVEQAGAWVIANGAGSLTTVAERLALEPVYKAVAEVPVGPRLRGGAYHGGTAPVWRAGAAAACREPGVYARRS